MTPVGWEPGDLVMCRTALGDEVFGTAVSGIVMGRDMQVVWIDFGDRHCLPWPVEAVRPPERCNSFPPKTGSKVQRYDGSACDTQEPDRP